MEELYTVSLPHNIGKLLIVLYFENEHEEIFSEMIEEASKLVYSDLKNIVPERYSERDTG